MKRRKLPSGVVVDTDRKRVTCPLPVSIRDLSSVFRLAALVCGRDAVVDTLVGERLGVMAMCAPGDGDVWRAELDARVAEYTP